MAMLKFLPNFFTDWTIQVKVDNILSDYTQIENGLQQRSVISVTLFLIAINDIFSVIQNLLSTHYSPMIVIFTVGVSTPHPNYYSILVKYYKLTEDLVMN